MVVANIFRIYIGWEDLCCNICASVNQRFPALDQRVAELVYIAFTSHYNARQPTPSQKISQGEKVVQKNSVAPDAASMKKYRLQEGITQRELAARINAVPPKPHDPIRGTIRLTQADISNFETGLLPIYPEIARRLDILIAQSPAVDSPPPEEFTPTEAEAAQLVSALLERARRITVVRYNDQASNIIISMRGAMSRRDVWDTLIKELHP